MKTKLTLPIAFVVGVLVAGAVALAGDLHVAELAVVGNALTIVF